MSIYDIDLSIVWPKLLKLRTEFNILPLKCNKKNKESKLNLLFQLKYYDRLALKYPSMWEDIDYMLSKREHISMIAPHLSYGELLRVYWKEKEIFLSLATQPELKEVEINKEVPQSSLPSDELNTTCKEHPVTHEEAQLQPLECSNDKELRLGEIDNYSIEQETIESLSFHASKDTPIEPSNAHENEECLKEYALAVTPMVDIKVVTSDLVFSLVATQAWDKLSKAQLQYCTSDVAHNGIGVDHVGAIKLFCCFIRWIWLVPWTY